METSAYEQQTYCIPKILDCLLATAFEHSLPRFEVAIL